MLQDQSRNRTPMPGAQAPAAAPPDTGPARAEAGIAAMLAAPTDIDAQAGEAQEVDWHNPPPGFMAFPAIEPSGFIRVERGLLLEVERLLRIAMAEFYRKTERAVPGEADEDRRQREADLRERLYIPPLVAAFDPDSDGAKALAAVNGGRAPGQPADTAPTGDAVDLAIEAHRSAQAAFTASCRPADRAHVRQMGGDTSDEAMAEAVATRDAASHAETAAWDALLAVRPIGANGLLRMLRYIGSATGDLEAITDGREFGRNLAEAAEASLRAVAPEPVAPDPILAGIAETRAALDRALAVEAASTGNLPPTWGDACEAAVEVLHERVIAVGPTTLDGCRAAARLMVDLRPGLGLELEEEVALLLKRIAGEPPTAAETPQPTLVDQIIAGWREWASRCGLDETDADRVAWERVTERRDALLDAAEALPPTLESLPAKNLSR